MRHSRLFSMALALGLAAATALPALAWPDQPPDFATIAGPGIVGEVKITDASLLASLALGAVEDFGTGPLAAAPKVGEGYVITRYFYGGTFNFARLTYYPAAAGAPGYVYFEDGPQLEGSHTPYDGRWLYVTASGAAALQKILETVVNPAPASAPAQRPVPWTALGWAALLAACAVAAAGALALRRRAPGTNPA